MALPRRGDAIAGNSGGGRYISGNVKAEKMVERMRVLRRRLVLEQERLRLQWISAGEGKLFAKTIDNMVQELKKLGHSPLGQGRFPASV